MKLWTAIVGSHMWRMNHKDSDLDLFVVYIDDTADILYGKNFRGGRHFQSDDKKLEGTQYELGHVVEQLQKGNINFLWGTTSPYIYYHNHFGRKLHKQLYDIVMANLPKNYFKAINGMAQKNLWKYFKTRVDVENKRFTHDIIHFDDRQKELKKLAQIYRTLLQGLTLMNDKFIEYRSAPYAILNFKNIKAILCHFHADYDECPLPEKPKRKPFYEFLVNARLTRMVN